MGKLFLSIIVGALVMIAGEKWKNGEWSAGDFLAAAQDLRSEVSSKVSSNTSKMQVSVQR